MGSRPYPFRIRRVEAEPAPAAAQSQPVASTPPSPPDVAFGALFDGPRRALDFLTALASRRLAEQVSCSWDGGTFWWIEADTAPEPATAAAEACGGAAYLKSSGRWTASSTGRLSGLAASAPSSFNPDTWTPVGAAGLAAATPFPETTPSPTANVSVLVPHAMAALVARRAFAIGADADRLPVERRALASDALAGGAVLLRLRRASGAFSASFLEALCDLPHTLVGIERGALLLDVRFTQAAGVIPDMIPEGDIWAIGLVDAGRWRLSALGEVQHAATLFTLPNVVSGPLPQALPVQAKASPLRVVHRPGVGTRTDALLLDARDLERFTAFARGRRMAETAVIAPGAERFLAYSPGGFGNVAPFGVVLERIGPGGVFLEADCALDPPLPRSARAALFPGDGVTAHVLTRDGVWRFDLGAAQPVWALWLKEPPAVKEVLPDGLLSFAKKVAELAIQNRINAEAAHAAEPLKQAYTVEDKRKLISAARQAELAGDLVGAAEAMERAGESLAAAHLFERAAAEAAE